MIPVTSFAGKTVAVFGLGGSGLASCHALKAGGAEVVAGDDSPDNVAKAAQAGFVTADLRTVSWHHFAALILTQTLADGRQLVSAVSRLTGADVMRRTRRSSRSPAPTANPPPRR